MEIAACSGQELGLLKDFPRWMWRLSIPSLIHRNSCVCSRVPESSPVPCPMWFACRDYVDKGSVRTEVCY